MSKRRTPRTPRAATKTTQASLIEQTELVVSEQTTPEPPAPSRDYHELAAEALADGWTREQVVHALIVRVSYDARYLAFRRATNRRTGYDAQVQQDMLAISLAAVWLENDREDLDAHAV
jgi:hypothetical protein